MAMLEYFSVSCDCDNCDRLDCPGGSPIQRTSQQARDDARSRGWIQTRHRGRVIDLCDRCKDGHRRKRPWPPHVPRIPTSVTAVVVGLVAPTAITIALVGQRIAG